MYISISPTGKETPDLNDSIQVRLTGNASSNVSVKLGDPVSVLLDNLPNKNSRLVYNGIMLNPALSFAFYGVSQRDLVYVISPKTKVVEKEDELSAPIPDITAQLKEHFDKNWAHKYSDQEAAFERYKNTVNPSTSLENARLMDLRKAKIESNPGQYRKICSHFRKIESNINKVSGRATSNSIKISSIRMGTT